MDEKKNEEMLRDLKHILYDDEKVDLPPRILSMMQEADATLREEKGLFREVKKRLQDLAGDDAASIPAPSFALEGEEEEPDDPISDVLSDSEE